MPLQNLCTYKVLIERNPKDCNYHYHLSRYKPNFVTFTEADWLQQGQHTVPQSLDLLSAGVLHSLAVLVSAPEVPVDCIA